MDTIVSILGKVSGIWKKVAAVLPLLAGAGSLLVGVGGLLLELAHSTNAGGALHVIQNLQSDPNTALIVGGLTALGVHTNHTSNVAAIQKQ